MADVLNPDINTAALIRSRSLHNHYLYDTALSPTIQSSEAFKDLCNIIAKYNVQDQVRLRHLHRHMTIPEGHVLFGKSIFQPSGYWATPTPIRDLGQHQIHGHVFSVNVEDDSDEAILLPSEFREGSPEGIGRVSRDFVNAFTHYVQMKGLKRIFGLEAAQGEPKKMIEFSFDIGSILLEENEIQDDCKRSFLLRDTTWAVSVGDEVVDSTGETRCVTFPNGHVKVTDGKANGAEDIIKILKAEGLLPMLTTNVT